MHNKLPKTTGVDFNTLVLADQVQNTWDTEIKNNCVNADTKLKQLKL